jgi:hypothetical protein
VLSVDNVFLTDDVIDARNLAYDDNIYPSPQYLDELDKGMMACDMKLKNLKCGVDYLTGNAGAERSKEIANTTRMPLAVIISPVPSTSNYKNLLVEVNCTKDTVVGGADRLPGITQVSVYQICTKSLFL